MREVKIIFFFFSSRRRHTRCGRDWSSDVCSSDLSRPVENRRCTQGSRKTLSAPRPGWSACLPVQHPIEFQSRKNSHQIDDCEDQDPDDVERVPEQRETVQAAHHNILKTSQ